MTFVGYFEGLIWGEKLGTDSTTIRANASMKSIVRKDSGKGRKDYTKKLAKKVGLVEGGQVSDLCCQNGAAREEGHGKSASKISASGGTARRSAA